MFINQDDSAEASDEISVIEDIAVMPPHTNYLCDPPEVFGTVSKSQKPLVIIFWDLKNKFWVIYEIH